MGMKGRQTSAESMKEQLKRGYLKLAILYALLEGPAHGYSILKKIRDKTLGLISPTVGSLYPALKDLERSGFIEGEWRGDGRRVKIYRITERGKEVFKEVVEGHLNLASAIKRWLLDQLAPIHAVEEVDASPEIIPSIVKMLLLSNEVSKADKIRFLRDLREKLEKVQRAVSNLIASIDRKLMELRADSGEG